VTFERRGAGRSKHSAWNKLIDMPWKIMSIGVRECAYRS